MEKIKLISSQDLQQKEIEPLKWIVKDLLPEGLTILAGSPKQGKSLLALNMAIAVSSAHTLMGKFETIPGKALYLPFEDGERRFQKRINDICKGYSLDSAPKNLLIPNDCFFPELNNEALGLLAQLIEQEEIQFVIIDPLGGAMAGGDVSQNYSYQHDYKVMKKFQQLANRKRISLLIVHHTRKAKADEVFDEISGTRGITGSADVNIVLKKNAFESLLHIQGRDIEENIYKLKLSRENFTYSFNGEGEIDRTSPQRKVILDLFKSYPDQEIKVEEIVEQSKMKNENVRQLLSSMREAGQLIDGSRRGYYKLPSLT